MGGGGAGQWWPWPTSNPPPVQIGLYTLPGPIHRRWAPGYGGLAMLPTELAVSAPVSEQPPAARRRWPRAAWLAGGVVVLIGYGALPWGRSFIDDPGALAILHGQQGAHGTLGGILAASHVWYRVDLDWGLFRPGWWLYAGTFYLLPAGAAHAVRLLMLGVAVAGPLALALRVRPVLVWAGAVVAANVSLYRGLWYVSLQELSGLCFVGLGLLARRRQWLRIAAFLCAAWFKAPFAWLLVGYGALLLFLGAAGAVAAAAGPRGRALLARGLAGAGLAVAVAVALLAVLAGGRYVYRNAATTTGLRDCLLGLPEGAVVGYNRPEAWDRLNAIVRYHRPHTRTRVALIPNGTPGPGLGYYIWEPDYGPGTPELRGPVVCRTPLATVYRTH